MEFNFLDLSTNLILLATESLASSIELLPLLTLGRQKTCKQLILMMRMIKAELLSSPC